jgi:dienelactone hydrolase
MKSIRLSVFLTLFMLFTMEMAIGLSQKTIAFPSKDGLTVTADIYENGQNLPYIILFHGTGSSRGEYRETAIKFSKFGYNCMAVDLRSGGEMNYIVNQTSIQAKEKGIPTTYLSSLQDMQAAIEYATKLSRKPVVIVGSLFSASLCLLLSKKNPQVSAVIAFSPGEFFEKPNFTRDTIEGLSVPVFISCSQDERPFVNELISKVDPRYITLFTPVKNMGYSGSKALWDNSATKDEYWLALLLFFNQIKE